MATLMVVVVMELVVMELAAVELVVVELVVVAMVIVTALAMTRAMAMASDAHSPAVRHCAVTDEQLLRVSQTRRSPLGAVQMVMIRCPEIQA